MHVILSNIKRLHSQLRNSPDSYGGEQGEHEGDEGGDAGQEHSLHVGEPCNKGSNPLISCCMAQINLSCKPNSTSSTMY